MKDNRRVRRLFLTDRSLAGWGQVCLALYFFAAPALQAEQQAPLVQPLAWSAFNGPRIDGHVDSLCGYTPSRRSSVVLRDGSVVAVALGRDGWEHYVLTTRWSRTGEQQWSSRLPTTGDSLSGAAEIAAAPNGDLAWLGTEWVESESGSGTQVRIQVLTGSGDPSSNARLDLGPGFYSGAGIESDGKRGWIGLAFRSSPGPVETILFRVSRSLAVDWTLRLPGNSRYGGLRRAKNGTIGAIVVESGGSSIALVSQRGELLAKTAIRTDPSRNESLSAIAAAISGEFVGVGTSCAGSVCEPLVGAVSSDGQLRFSRRLQVPGFSGGTSTAVAVRGSWIDVDVNGSVGSRVGAGIVRLNLEGEFVFSDEIESGTFYADRANAIAISSTGDSLIVGKGRSGQERLAFAALYGVDGSRKWLQLSDPEAASSDAYCGAHAGAAGGYFAVGDVYRRTRDLHIVALAEDGEPAWERTEPPSDTPVDRLGCGFDLSGKAAAAAEGGGLWFVGSSQLDTGGAVLAGRRGSSLAEVSSSWIDSTADGCLNAIVPAKSNGAFVTGTVRQPWERMFVARLDARSQPLWRWSLEDALFSGGSAVAATPDGGVVVAGFSRPNGNRDFVVVKLDRFGNESWRYQVDRLDDRALDVHVAADGTVFATGESWAGVGSPYECLTVRLTPGGDEIWRRLDSLPGPSYSSCKLIRGAPGGGVLVAGTLGGNLGLIRYSPEGNLDWTFSGQGSAIPSGFIRSAEFAGDGSIRATGWTSEGSVSHPWLASISAIGQLVWERRPFVSPYSFGSDIQMSPGGIVHLAGYRSDQSIRGLFVEAWSEDGDRLWEVDLSSIPYRSADVQPSLVAGPNGVLTLVAGVSLATEDVLFVDFPVGGTLFFDGFESGNASAWTTESP